MSSPKDKKPSKPTETSQSNKDSDIPVEHVLADFGHEFYSSFADLFELYEEVKKIILLAEYEISQQYLVASANELRSALDHIMRTIGDRSTLFKNFDKAKGHIYRAGYDAYEILAIAKINEIKKIKEQFSYNAIVAVYSKYLTDVLPQLEIAKQELVFARGHKDIQPKDIDATHEKKYFTNFGIIVAKLTELADDINKYIPSFKEAQRHRRIDFYRDIIFLRGVLPVIVGIFVAFFSFKVLQKGSKIENDKIESGKEFPKVPQKNNLSSSITPNQNTKDTLKLQGK
jgi:hypothetical protein